jgi:hypothetical protein
VRGVRPAGAVLSALPGPARSDVAWLVEARRRLRRAVDRRRGCLLFPQERALLDHAVRAAYRDLAALGLEAEARALVRAHTGVPEEPP